MVTNNTTGIVVELRAETSHGLEVVTIWVNGTKATEFMGLRMAISWIKKHFPDHKLIQI